MHHSNAKEKSVLQETSLSINKSAITAILGLFTGDTHTVILPV